MSYFFSIIIPVYNTEEYLPRALDSILNQDFDTGRIEVVVVNDGSPKSEECRVIVKEYSKKLHIKFIDNEKNQGLYMARKLGVANVNHNEGYLLHLDSDDFLERNALSILYKDIQKKGDADYIEFSFFKLKDTAKIRNSNEINIQKKTLENILSYKQNHTIWNKCFKISFIKNIYANMPDFYSYYNEDYYQMGIIDYYAKNIRYIKSSLYVYVLGTGVTGVIKYKKEKIKKIILSIYNVEKYLCDFYQDRNCENYIPLVENFSQYLYSLCLSHSEPNDFFDVYIELLGIERFKMFFISHVDSLNNTIRIYEKKMRLFLPIKILIKPFRAFYRFFKKCCKKKN